VRQLDVYWLDRYRPELFWRTFAADRKFSPSMDGVLIFRRVPPRPSFRL
jgi:hypothetical protein